MKKIVTMTMVTLLLLGVFTFIVSAQENVSVYIEGEIVEFDVQPQVINGRTMVPMRKIFEQLGATVEWEQTTQTIIGKKEDMTIVMQIDNNELSVNDNVSTLDVAPIVIDGRTLVPVRAIAESFGIDVLWYEDIETVAIYNDKESIEKKILYNLKGNSVKIDVNFEEKYLALGWSSDINEIETVCLYAPNGKTKNVYVGNVANAISVGWSTEPVVTMYALDGRTQYVKKTDVEANKKVGWYETKAEVMQNVYSITGAKEVYKAEVDTYLQQGWRASQYPITVTDNCVYSRNSADGIKLYWKAINTSGKTINYYTATLYFFNPVGDPAYDQITKKSYKKYKVVGPCVPGDEVLIFDIVGYVRVCDIVVIADIILEYNDGTTEELWCGQMAREGDLFRTKWNSSDILPNPYTD